METVNFEIKDKSFKAGWYTLENFRGLPTYWLVFEDTNANVHKINNCGLMLTLFNELPNNATINAHLLIN